MNNETDNRATPEPSANGEAPELARRESPAESRIPEYEISWRPTRPDTVWTKWMRQGLRASALRPPQALPQGPSAWQMLLIVGICFAISIGVSRFEVDGPAQFSITSWLFSWASTGLAIGGAWLIINFGSKKALHASPVAAWFLLSSIAAIPISLIGTGLYLVVARNEVPQWLNGTWYAWSSYVGLCIWCGAVTWRIAQAINRSAWIIAALVLWTLINIGLDGTLLRSSAWEPVYVDESNDRATLSLSQEVFETQQTLLNEALRAIKPHEGNQRQIYGLIYAPYSQDVFLRESAMVQEVLEQRFGAQGHIVRLVNHPSTAVKIPWATNRNLERSLEALAKVMDTERDVLVLYLTSHGGADFVLATQHWPLEVASLTASELRSTLDKIGISNRVITISACYSGGWIEPLKNDNTLIMTAADKDHTSYGCGSKSTLTFFGRALFDEQLRKTLSFEDAFKAAVPIIAERETTAKKSDGFSNPQISVGKEIKAVLHEWATQQTPAALKPTTK